MNLKSLFLLPIFLVLELLWVLLNCIEHLVDLFGWFIASVDYSTRGFVSNQRAEQKPSIVIIGGGFAGLLAARGLQHKFIVTVIDPKDYIEFIPGILRTFVEPSHFSNIYANYNDDLKKSIYYRDVRFVKDFVSTIHHKHVVTAKGKEYYFDYLLITCGKGYTTPVGTSTETKPDIRQQTVEREYQKIQEAKRILIAGGGPVGVELAAEILTAFPNKSITLVVGPVNTLLKDLPHPCHEYADSFLRKHGATIVYNDAVKTIKNNTGYTLKGQVIEADLVYECTGLKTSEPQIDFTSLSGQSFTPKGRIVVKPTLQLPGFNNIFAAGDIVHLADDEIKVAHAAELHAMLVVKNIQRLHEGKQPLRFPEGISNLKTIPNIMVISLVPNHMPLFLVK